MDLNLLAACEALIGNTSDSLNVSSAYIKRWQSLFQFDFTEARTALEDWRKDLGRLRIPDSVWAVIQNNWPGYDKEAYEFALARGKLSATYDTATTKQVTGPEKAQYIFVLEHGMPNVEEIQRIGGLALTPAVHHGENDDGEPTRFCIVNNVTKKKIEDWLSVNESSSLPRFIRHSEAEKDLQAHSRYPTLGIHDTTLPQFRMDDSAASPTPLQDDYPVWYFFYGTLAQADVLSRILRLPPDKTPKFHASQVRGGHLTTWGGKYKALTHSAQGLDGAPIQGWTYLIRSREEENALRSYETDRYAVVRCQIEFTEGETVEKTVPGLSFMFV